MNVEIQLEAADSVDAIQLVKELDDILIPLYPAESHHGYDVGKLLREGVDLFVARVGGEAAGCGGVQFFGNEYGELKRMYVRPAFRGLGLGKAILSYLVDYSAEQGMPVLRLETGIHQTEAISLYERFGFTRIPPFDEYWDDPLSLFMELRLDDASRPSMGGA